MKVAYMIQHLLRRLRDRMLCRLHGHDMMEVRSDLRPNHGVLFYVCRRHTCRAWKAAS